MNVITLMLAIAIGSLAFDFINEMVSTKKVVRRKDEAHL